MKPVPQPLRSLPLFTSAIVAVTMLLAPRSQARSAGFESTGSMAEVRAVHTSVLLQDGTVLVAGGQNGSGISISTVASAERYDPASRSWSATGSLNNSRAYHTATVLPNGKVLVVGGRDSVDDLATAELYDPATGTWSFTGSLNASRRSHTATLLSNGKVLVTGGLRGGQLGSNYQALSSAELYDPATGTWTFTGSLGVGRGDHTATLLSDGKVLVAGGRPTFSGASSAPLNSAEVYDPATGLWLPTGSLNTGRWAYTATLLPNGEVLAAAGFGNGVVLDTAEIYSPTTGTWRATGSLAKRRAFHTATLLPNQKVLVAGGDLDPFNALASAQLYDPASGTWTTTGGLETRRVQHTATLLSDGTVLVAGGTGNENGSVYFKSAELYVDAIPTLLNISTRMHVQTGDNALIAGFIITGTAQKTVIVRGIGPSLAIPGALANPVIEVHGPAGELLGTNDNWRDALTAQQINDSGLAPSNDLESALWGVINPGAYTVILSGKDGGTGVGSVEVYDLDEPADSRLANISTRGFVETGDNVMIAGLIVGGGSAFGDANVYVRARGPSLPINGALADPTLELHDSNGNVIAFNDDWKLRSDGSSQQAEILATTIAPTKDAEPALLRRLAAGNYTAIVRGKDDTTGVALVEVYHLQ